MKVLLDENMPSKLLSALAAEGREVDSVKSLQLQGIANGALYELAASAYDLCFTRDAEFSNRVFQFCDSHRTLQQFGAVDHSVRIEESANHVGNE